MLSIAILIFIIVMIITVFNNRKLDDGLLRRLSRQWSQSHLFNFVFDVLLVERNAASHV